MAERRRLILGLSSVFALTTGCAVFRRTDVNGPTPNMPQYPVPLSDVGPRLQEASVAWYQLSQRYSLPGKTEANLQPYTRPLNTLLTNLSIRISIPPVE